LVCQLVPMDTKVAGHALQLTMLMMITDKLHDNTSSGIRNRRKKFRNKQRVAAHDTLIPVRHAALCSISSKTTKLLYMTRYTIQRSSADSKPSPQRNFLCGESVPSGPTLCFLNSSNEPNLSDPPHIMDTI